MYVSDSLPREKPPRSEVRRGMSRVLEAPVYISPWRFLNSHHATDNETQLSEQMAPGTFSLIFLVWPMKTNVPSPLSTS